MDLNLKFGMERVMLRSFCFFYLSILCISWINFVHTIEYKSSANLLVTVRPRPHYRTVLIPTRNRHGKQLPRATVSNAKLPAPTAIVSSFTKSSIVHNSNTIRPPFSGTTNSFYHLHHSGHEFNHNENLKNHIKRVLDLEGANETLDKYIMSSFNLYNADPMYMFVLPGEKNRTLIFHRSNFTEAIFPDIVPLKQLRKLSYASHQIAHQKNYHDLKADKYSKSDEIPKNKFDQFKNGAYDLDEASSLKIIEENVRTERNFLEFMEDLNRNQENEIEQESRQLTSVSAKDDQGLNEYEVVLKNIQDKSTNEKQLLLTGETLTEVKEFNRRRAQGISWREMGLEGWLGSLNPKYTVPVEPGKLPPNGLLRHPNEHLLSHPKEHPITSNPKAQTIPPKNYSIVHPKAPSFTSLPKAHTIPPTKDHSIALPKDRPIVQTNKFIPILATFDSLAFLTTTSRPSTIVPDLPQFDDKIPPHIKSYTFVRLYKQNHVTSTTSPWPSTTINHHHPAPPSWATTTPKSTDLFSPADGYLNAGEYIHNKKPQFDYKIYLPNGLRDLLKAEREKLRNISLTIGYDYKAHRMWPLTNSRSAHRDEDVYIGRANNPFGHSTRWKWNNATKHNSGVEGRHKRGVIELYSMVKCATGCDPLVYKGYGCYCGFLGSGRALDGIDRCCKMHDYCYATANCPKFLEYFVPYIWKCYKGRPLCAIDHGEWGGPSSCPATLCQCDQALSKCLRRFHCPRKRAVCTSSPARLLQNLLMSL